MIVDCIRAAIDLDARSIRRGCDTTRAMRLSKPFRGTVRIVASEANLFQDRRVIRDDLACMAADHGDTLASHGTIIRALEGCSLGFAACWR